MAKRNNIINLGLNEIVGNIIFGEGCIINPTCSIICEKKDENFKVIFGDYNVIEERAVIMFKPVSEKDNVMRIGSYNTFGIKSYVMNTQVGDGNTIEAKAEIKDGVIGNYNVIGSDTKISKKNIGSHFRIFAPGIMKEVDIIDDERIRENMKDLYATTKALQAKETKP
jgi:carbonic anhydrase/acetyltransferase-like protein (isoleucine patch superfamily)